MAQGVARRRHHRPGWIWYDGFNGDRPNDLSYYTTQNSPILSGGLLLANPGSDTRITMLTSEMPSGLVLVEIGAKFQCIQNNSQMDVWVAPNNGGSIATRLQITNAGVVNLYNTTGGSTNLGTITLVSNSSVWVRYFLHSTGASAAVYGSDPNIGSPTPLVSGSTAFAAPTSQALPQIRMNAATDGVVSGLFGVDDFYIWALSS